MMAFVDTVYGPMDDRIGAIYRKLCEADPVWFHTTSGRKLLAKCYRTARKISGAQSRILRNSITVIRLMP